MLLDNGAEPVGDPTQCHAVAIDARAPKFDGGIVTRLDCVLVRHRGEQARAALLRRGRGLLAEALRHLGAARRRAAGPDRLLIVDAKSIDAFMPSLFPPVQAGSIRELARKLELDPDALDATVNGFNAAVRPGTFDHTTLDDCRTEGLDPPKSHWARRIDTPPFYAYPLRPGITFTYLGTAWTSEARMLMQGGGAAQNMFAAGEIMAGNILGRGYVAGFGMTIGSVFGRIAGREAAAMSGTS